MTRLICSILAAGSTALSMAAPASAHEVRYDEHATAPMARRVDYDGYRGEQWRELQMTRQRFYGRPHSRSERARFERWYARRCDELRYRR